MGLHEEVCDMHKELVQRVTALEVKHEERHVQTLGIMERMEQTQERIASSVESLADSQSKMAHLGAKTDEHAKKLENHEVWLTKLTVAQETIRTRQSIIWAAGGVAVTAIVGIAIKVLV